jgi:hypothetical protein
MHYRKPVSIGDYNSLKRSTLAHMCSTQTGKDKNGRRKRVNSNLFYVHEWCSDKTNCQSCIRIVQKEGNPEKYDTTLTSAERHRIVIVLTNFDFHRRNIICVHCVNAHRFQIKICVLNKLKIIRDYE